ncbi:o-succinylbenzoate synthase [Priestia filamentosa]|uniref:o-succinylbenzoate synthase n=1 Tax=Priestia filamentosa TaxID=1402861 RepID=UPI00234B8700|nr:o-succinylbenzoate synthase [Priestia filamentosa]WCM15413.1 o-succinylbenzoate synthase [Priestia filamentosa]
MKIENIILYRLSLSLKSPFSTKYGTVKDREFLLLKVKDETGAVGWGECVAFDAPWYTEETVDTCEYALKHFLIPFLKGKKVTHPRETTKLFSFVQGHSMAKASLDLALWDLYAKKLGKPLGKVLGGTASKISSGVAIGISDEESMIQSIDRYVKAGYKRFKIKIKPGHDYEVLKKIRQQFPDLPLMADANASYTFTDMSLLEQLDTLNLMMIEQPFGKDEFFQHSELQKVLKTPICLDESITSVEKAYQAIQFKSCKILVVKPGRIGGLSPSLQIHELALKHHFPLWVGGMIESGVSRAHNVALASLPGFTIPGDISASDRYWRRDVVKKGIKVSDGHIEVPSESGLGFFIDEPFIDQIAIKKEEF